MKLDGAAFRMVPLLDSANCCRLSIAFTLFCQSFVFVPSTNVLNCSIKPLSTGLETDAVRFLNVFCDSPNPVEEP